MSNRRKWAPVPDQELQQRTNLIRAVHLLSDPIDQMVFEVVLLRFHR